MTKKFWVGNQGNPADRTAIQVNQSSAAVIESATQRAIRGEHFEVEVFDLLSDRWVTLADESCGQSCRCGLRFITPAVF
jgi:exo-beta-1,3-glucanase (GH17 family)